MRIPDNQNPSGAIHKLAPAYYKNGGSIMPLFGLGGPPDIEKLTAKRDVQELIKALNYKRDDKVCCEAATALGKLGIVSAIEPLVAIYKNRDTSPTLKEAANDALIDLRAPFIMYEMCGTLKVNTDQKVVENIATTLALFGQSAVQLLVDTLCESYSSCWALETALILIGEPSVEPLIAALKSPKLRKPDNIIGPLGELGDPRAIEPLISFLKENEYAAEEVFRALEKLGSPAQESIRTYLASTSLDDRVRSRAMAALAKLGDTQVMETFLADLGSGDRDVRLRAAEALGKTNDPRAIQALTTALTDSDTGVRRRVADALGQIGDPCAIQALTSALTDNDWWVSHDVANALKRLDEAAAKKIIFKLCASQGHLLNPWSAQILEKMSIRRCARCGYEVVCANHVWGEWQPDNSDPDLWGAQIRSCMECGYKEYRRT